QIVRPELFYIAIIQSLKRRTYKILTWHSLITIRRIGSEAELALSQVVVIWLYLRCWDLGRFTGPFLVSCYWQRVADCGFQGSLRVSAYLVAMEIKLLHYAQQTPNIPKRLFGASL